MKKGGLLIVLILIISIIISFFLKVNIVGFVTYTPGFYNWSFEDSNSYVYNSGLILIENNSARLKEIEYNFSDNLVSEYYFDEGTWINATVVDNSGVNNGIAYGADTVEGGKINRGGVFDGINDYVDLDMFDVVGDGLTIVAWFKADDFGVSDGRIISKATNQAEQNHYWMLSTITQAGNKRLRFRLKTDGTTKTLNAGSGNLNAGEWIHAAAVYNGTDMVLYKDGVEVDYTSKTGTISVDDEVSVWIGDNPGIHRKQFDGVIDEVAIYNTSLSPLEISEIYTSQSQRSRTYNYYDENASLETENLDLADVNRLNVFSGSEELNGQEINYYYSDGSGWNEILNNSLPSLEQIKIKIEFNSNKTDTPILYSMVLNYEYCDEDWNCGDWSECYENSSKSRNCVDSNECGIFEDKPEEVENCTYFARYYEVNDTKLVSFEANETTVVNLSGVVLDLISEEDSVSINIEVKRDLDNLSFVEGKEMIKNMNISVDGLNFSSGIIKFYYDDSWDEDSLGVYYYNNGSWEILNTTINKEENYLYSSVSHFSIYAIFGNVKEEPSSSGSGSKRKDKKNESVEEVVEIPSVEEDNVREKVEVKQEEKVLEVSNSPTTKTANALDKLTGFAVNVTKKPRTIFIGLLILILLINFLRRYKFKKFFS